MIPTMSLTGEMVVERRWIKPKDITRGDLVTYLTTSAVCQSVFLTCRLVVRRTNAALLLSSIPGHQS